MRRKSKCLRHAMVSALLLTAVLLPGCSRWQTSPAPALTRQGLQQFRDGLRTQHDDAGYHYRLGRHFQERGDFALAIGEFRRSLTIDPGQPDSYTALGVCYDSLRQFELARQCYRNALALNPADAHARNNLGYSYLLQGDALSAIVELRQAVAQDEKNARFQNNLTAAQRLVGKRLEEWLLTGRAPTFIPAPPQSAHDRQSPALAQQEVPMQPASDSLEERAQRAVARGLDVQPGASVAAAQSGPVQIEICNGNGIHRMAAYLGRYLKARGFNVVAQRNADRFDYSVTSIRYGNGARESAGAVAQQLWGAEYNPGVVQNGYAEGRIKVVLGKDAAHLNAVFDGRLPVVVLNGNGRKGAAEGLRRFLNANGFMNVRPVDADHFEYPQTQIIYPEGYQDCARFVAGAMPSKTEVAQVKDTHGTKQLRIVIGRDFL